MDIKKLAIRGVLGATTTNGPVKFLEDLGFKNTGFWNGNATYSFYYGATDGRIVGYAYPPKGYIKCTLEEAEKYLKESQGKIVRYTVIMDNPWVKKGVEVFPTDPIFADAGNYPNIFSPIYEEVYKAGDWVTITSSKRNYSGKHVGETFEIGYISGQSTNDFACETSKDNGNGVFFESLRKATAEEIEKAKDIYTIGGYPLEITDKKEAKFGCQVFTKDQVGAFIRFVHNGGKVSIGKSILTEGLLTKIYNKL